MLKVALQNLGCSKNQIDGERILHFLKSSSFECTGDFTEADIIIVNTCAFIREAQEEAIESILEMAELRKKEKCVRLVVSGCFSERYRAEVKKRFPEVDLWIGVDDWEQALRSWLQNEAIFPSQEKALVLKTASFKRVLSEPVASQYLKIAEGCSHACTFCVIPSIRGPFKSRYKESILEEAQWLESMGVKELILVAQDSSFYGRDTGLSLEKLLEFILDKTNFPWIRMMYLHPKYVTDRLISLISSQPRLCPYFDIPLQHISDTVLKAMNRTPLSEGIFKLVEKVRTRVPGAALRTSFISGFPGETAADHDKLVRFVEEFRFDKVGVFPYSPEEGTKSYSMKKRPSAPMVHKRCEELMLIQREISREIQESKVGSRIPVIVERVAEDPDFNYEARSRLDAPEIDGKVLISKGSYEIGSITEVTITGAGDYDLYA